MKIEEMLPSDFVKINRKTAAMAKIPGRLIAKKVLLVITAGVMCIGFYHYGYQSNQNAIRRYVSSEPKVVLRAATGPIFNPMLCFSLSFCAF